MNDALLVAISKLIETPTLAPGVHPVNGEVTFRVNGCVKKSEDTEYVPTVDIPLITSLALVLEKSGITRERSMTLLVEAMQEALALGNHGSDHIQERINDVQEAIARVREITNSLPKKTRTGRTTVDATLAITNLTV